MRFFFLAAVVLVLASGCAVNQQTPRNSTPASTPAAINSSASTTDDKPAGDSKLIVTPENLLVGAVTTYNTAGRFVVLDFPVGRMPVTDQVLFVYRQGLKVGEVKVAGPQRDSMTVADLIAGEARKGDQVQDK